MTWLLALLAHAAAMVQSPAPTPVEQARALAGEGRSQEAIALLEAAIAGRPDDAALHNLLGAIFNREGRFAEALPHAQRAAELEPDEPRYRYNRGIVLAEHGRMVEALEDFDFAIAAMPGQAPMQLERGAALLALGRGAEARSAWASARKQDPALVWTDWYEGLHDLIDGKAETAIAKMGKVATAQPDFASAQAWLLLAHGLGGAHYAPADLADPWVAALAGYNSGRLEFESLLSAARADNVSGDARRVGEAWLHHGIRLAAQGNAAEARKALARAKATDAPRHAWKLLAERELARISAR